jgi:NADPH:quinone reductase-like Zn-dependent oxidoreductase
MRYRRVVVSRHGGPDVLQVAEANLPDPAAGEVRVKVLAAGVSAFDLMYRRSSHQAGTRSRTGCLRQVGVGRQVSATLS